MPPVVLARFPVIRIFFEEAGRNRVPAVRIFIRARADNDRAPVIRIFLELEREIVAGRSEILLWRSCAAVVRVELTFVGTYDRITQIRSLLNAAASIYFSRTDWRAAARDVSRGDESSR